MSHNEARASCSDCLAALDISCDDSTSTLVAVGSQCPRDNVNSCSNDSRGRALDIFLRRSSLPTRGNWDGVFNLLVGRAL